MTHDAILASHGVGLSLMPACAEWYFSQGLLRDTNVAVAHETHHPTQRRLFCECFLDWPERVGDPQFPMRSVLAAFDEVMEFAGGGRTQFVWCVPSGWTHFLRRLIGSLFVSCRGRCAMAGGG